MTPAQTQSGAPRERHQVRLATISFVCSGDDVLLLRHAPASDRFAGRWNGIGGHVERGEDILEAARRELREEAGLDPGELRLRGLIHETGLLGHAYVVFVFVGHTTTRATRPAPGIELVWHPIGGLGELALVEDLTDLLPRVLRAREPLFVTETFDGGDRLLSLRVAEPAGALTGEPVLG